MVFYKYDIQDGDTPEIVAHKYYNDSYRYWVVLFANEILDPQWGWPLNSQQFESYIKDKYGLVNPNSIIDHYEKIVTTSTQTDSGIQTTSNSVIIDEETYNSLIPSTKTYTLPTGNVTVEIDRKIVSAFEQEVNKNESKRNINILNSRYVEQLESEIKKLMA